MDPLGWTTAGGLFSAGIAAFHLTFWRIFRWDSELARLGPVNRAVMQVMNIVLTLLLGGVAWVSIAHRQEMVATALGRALLAGVAAIWAIRALLQPIFFGRSALSWAFTGLFLAGAALYAAARAAA